MGLSLSGDRSFFPTQLGPLGCHSHRCVPTTKSRCDRGKEVLCGGKIAKGAEVKTSRGHHGQRIISLNLELTRNFNRSSLTGCESGAKMIMWAAVTRELTELPARRGVGATVETSNLGD